MKVSEMETTDIKIMLTTMSKQIKSANGSYSKRLIKEMYKDHIEACENELKKRGENYESCIING